MSKHKLPYLLCPHAGKDGHTTKTSGAHKIPKDIKTAFPLFLILGAAASTKGAAVGETGISHSAVHAASGAPFDGFAPHAYSPPMGGLNADWLASARTTAATAENLTHLEEDAAAHRAGSSSVFNRLEEVCEWLLDVATSATPLDGRAVVDAPAHCLYRDISVGCS